MTLHPDTPGHMLPGLFFISFALWHIVNISLKYFKSKERNGPSYKSSVYFACSCCFCGFPVESCVKLGFCGLMVFAPTFINRLSAKDVQHVTMYYFFGMTGLMEILHYYKLRFPPSLMYLTSALAFVVEGMIFESHSIGLDPIIVRAHRLLFYTIFGIVISGMVELSRRTSVLPALCRAFMVLLQGLWFFQVGVIYMGFVVGQKKERSHQELHDDLMMCNAKFAGYAGLAFFWVLAIWFAVACKFRHVRRRKSQNFSRIGEDTELGEPGSEDELVHPSDLKLELEE